MDNDLLTLMDLASQRGNKYVKGETALDGIHMKMAELGVLLLETAKRFPEFDDQQCKKELIEVQQKLDDLRKTIFNHKMRPLG